MATIHKLRLLPDISARRPAGRGTRAMHMLVAPEEPEPRQAPDTDFHAYYFAVARPRIA